jgi:hypothetical protein
VVYVSLQSARLHEEEEERERERDIMKTRLGDSQSERKLKAD